MHYINGWCRIVVAVNSPMRVDAWSCMNVFGTSDASIIDDSRSGMSGVTFRTAPPIGGFSCCLMSLLRLPSFVRRRPPQSELLEYLKNGLT